MSSKFDLTEELTIIGLCIIAVYTLFYTATGDIPQIIAAGLIGYLSKGKKE